MTTVPANLAVWGVAALTLLVVLSIELRAGAAARFVISLVWCIAALVATLYVLRLATFTFDLPTVPGVPWKGYGGVGILVLWAVLPFAAAWLFAGVRRNKAAQPQQQQPAERNAPAQTPAPAPAQAAAADARQTVPLPRRVVVPGKGEGVVVSELQVNGGVELTVLMDDGGFFFADEADAQDVPPPAPPPPATWTSANPYESPEVAAERAARQAAQARPPRGSNFTAATQTPIPIPARNGRPFRRPPLK